MILCFGGLITNQEDNFEKYRQDIVNFNKQISPGISRNPFQKWVPFESEIVVETHLSRVFMYSFAWSVSLEYKINPTVSPECLSRLRFNL